MDNSVECVLMSCMAVEEGGGLLFEELSPPNYAYVRISNTWQLLQIDRPTKKNLIRAGSIIKPQISSVTNAACNSNSCRIRSIWYHTDRHEKWKRVT